MGAIGNPRSGSQRRARPPVEFPPSLHAVSLSGVERPVYRAADWLVLHDISADGRVLLSRNTIRINLTCQRPGETSERDLTWQLASAAKGISPDGGTVIFEDELLSSPSGNPVIFSRSIEGAPAIAMGEGSRATLSPDGKWVLALRGEDLVLLPTGVGATVTLPKGELARVGNGAWLPDSKRIVFTGYTADNTPRGYLQEIPAGLPRAITPSGVVLADRAAAPDENAVLGRAGATWALFPIQGGDDRPFQRSHLAIFRFNGATAADICTPSPALREPGRQPLVSLAWRWRAAAAPCGRLSRRPTPWESKT